MTQSVMNNVRIYENKGLKGYLHYLELLNPQNGQEGNTDIKLVTTQLIFL